MIATMTAINTAAVGQSMLPPFRSIRRQLHGCRRHASGARVERPHDRRRTLSGAAARRSTSPGRSRRRGSSGGRAAGGLRRLHRRRRGLADLPDHGGQGGAGGGERVPGSAGGTGGSAWGSGRWTWPGSTSRRALPGRWGRRKSAGCCAPPAGPTRPGTGRCALLYGTGLRLAEAAALDARAAASASSHAIAGQGLPSIEHSSA
jgi:hypothetical protein